jgi:hypothetical protein
LVLAACDSNKNNGVNDLSGNANEDLAGANNDLSGVVTCGLVGDACANNAACCSNNCDSTAHICISSTAMCKNQGATCGTATECCSVNCTNSTCGGACTADYAACTAGTTACCSGTCANGMCQPLNTTCKTAGNPCTAPDGGTVDAGSGNCCSGLCVNGTCSISSSYCTQTGDVCASGPECCTGVCTKAANATLGVCGQLNSPVSCAIDGTICNGCGGCCSRLCAPYAQSGVHICQPASGCHVFGDLCRKDSDCCGGEAPDAGLPGAGLVKCTIVAGTGGIGYCDHPKASNGGGNTCDPEGNVCHFQNYACSNSSDRNDCCACISSKTCCQLDSLGIPRCNAINPADGGTCVPLGGNCSFNGDCCGGAPCVPDSSGQLKCGVGTDGGMCVPLGGPCTTTADCCSGITCVVPAGALKGTCDNIVVGNPGTDAGPPPVCSQIGQSCATNPCCPGLNCTSDANGQSCGTTGAGCSCTQVIG